VPAGPHQPAKARAAREAREQDRGGGRAWRAGTRSGYGRPGGPGISCGAGQRGRGAVALPYRIPHYAKSIFKRLLMGYRAAVPQSFISSYGAGLFPRFALPVGYASSMLVLARLFQRESGLSYEGSLAAVSIAEGLSFAASTVFAVGGAATLLVFPSVLSPAWRLPIGLALGVGGLEGYEAVGVGALSVFAGVDPETAVATVVLFRRHSSPSVTPTRRPGTA